jgi:hypothetical protein
MWMMRVMLWLREEGSRLGSIHGGASDMNGWQAQDGFGRASEQSGSRRFQFANKK